MRQSIKKQKGISAVIVTIGLIVILGMSGLVFDLGNSYLNRTRLQNALDAAVLSGAKTLDVNGSTTADAEAEVLATFALNYAGAIDETVVPTVEFSQTLDPFVPGAIEPDARYVRANLNNVPMPSTLIRVLPGIDENTLAIAGSAVAGPSPPLGPEFCNVAPLLMCGDPSDTDCSDNECFGYTFGDEEGIELKTHSGNSNDWEVGPGNFQLIQLDCGPGGSCVRDNLAGDYNGCATVGDSVTTKPGNTVGPTAQGFNTRFGIYQGAGMNPVDYPPDTVTHSNHGSFWHDNYLDKQQNHDFDFEPIENGGLGVAGRRILAVPIGLCTGTTNGQGQVQVLGMGCFFMTKEASHQGNTQTIYGQLIGECEADGSISEHPPAPGTTGSILYKIILYKDPDSRDT